MIIDGIDYKEITDSLVLPYDETDMYLYKVFAGAAIGNTIYIDDYDVYEVSVQTGELMYKYMLIHIKEEGERTEKVKQYYVKYHIGSGGVITMPITVNLGYSMEQPIWKDTYCTLSGTDYYDYRIESDNTEIYRGRCYSFNNQCRFKLNDVCKNYLSNSIQFSNNPWLEETDNKKEFTVYVSTDNFTTESKYVDAIFWNDWSYEEYTGEAAHYLSNSIIPIVDRRQYFLFSGMFDSGTVNTYTDTAVLDTTTFSGVVKTYVKYVPDIVSNIRGEFTEAFNGDWLVWRSTDDVAEYTISYNNWKTYLVKNTCKKYCLYYLNARGGWDWLVIDGSEQKNYNYSRQTYTQNYDNTTLEAGKVNFRNDIQESWNLTTGYLTDTQSGQMFNLFGSVKVYLHNLETGKIIPVVITNTSQVEKTFRNQGRKLYNYTITVDNAQTKTRM